MQVKLSITEGRILFELSSIFGGANQKHPPYKEDSQKVLADDSVSDLRKVLKKKHCFINGNGAPIFGLTGELKEPTKCALCGNVENLIKGHEICNSDACKKVYNKVDVDVNLHDDDRVGAFWVLLSALDPNSTLKQPVEIKDDIIWPIAEELKMVKRLRKDLGLEDAKKIVIEMDGGSEPKKE